MGDLITCKQIINLRGKYIRILNLLTIIIKVLDKDNFIF